MANPIELQKGRSTADWVNALEKHGKPKLAEHLREDRAAGFEAARDLGLPTPKFGVFRPLSQFFEVDPERGILDPEDHLKQLGVDRLFISLAPKKSDLLKYSHHPLKPDQVTSYIMEHVPPEYHNLYNFVVGEYAQNHYGGVIVVQPDGRQLGLELVKGGVSTLTRGATPDFIVAQDKHTGFFHYSNSFDDEPDLKEIVYSTISAIPHHDNLDDAPYESRHRKYTPVA